MLSKQDAQNLMCQLISLRKKANSTNNKQDIEALAQYENHCIEQFKYLVTMRTSRYKGFSNYDDLNQDGLEALVKAMKNYDPDKGIFFYWAHKYIDTRIARNANLHTAIRYPLKFAKKNKPHRENKIPIVVEHRPSSDRIIEHKEMMNALEKAMNTLNDEQKTLIRMLYGIDNDKPMSIAKICRKTDMPRTKCIKRIKTAIKILRQYIEI